MGPNSVNIQTEKHLQMVSLKDIGSIPYTRTSPLRDGNTMNGNNYI